MSRAGTQDVVTVKPANNVYTVLAVVALIVVGVALFVLYRRSEILFGPGGLTS